jgi:hypothetical protein
MVVSICSFDPNSMKHSILALREVASRSLSNNGSSDRNQAGGVCVAEDVGEWGMGWFW